MTNGDKIRFVNAITAGVDVQVARPRGWVCSWSLGDTTGPLASSEAWRYHRAADLFSDCAKASESKVLTPNWPEDVAEEGHAQPKVAA
jgi:hypothetical protein